VTLRWRVGLSAQVLVWVHLCGRIAAALTIAVAGSAQAGSPRLCEQGIELSAAQKDRRLRLVAAVRQELEASGDAVAIVSRSGVDLSRFDQRYSHAGIGLRRSPNTPWSVRQLYYACDEGLPRLFDQGLAGFLLAADDSPSGHVSLVLLPAEAADALERAALDRPTALHLLATRYSANAHVFSTRYQNCNQWVAELLAAAWAVPGSVASREQAQQWLRHAGYAGHRFETTQALSWIGHLVPLLHHDDHPPEDLARAVFQVSMPQSIEAFVHRRLPQARRIELCHDERQIVIHVGWTPLGPGCEAGPGDRRVLFEPTPAPAGPANPYPSTVQGGDPTITTNIVAPGPADYPPEP
jgi:hypothetical protein